MTDTATDDTTTTVHNGSGPFWFRPVGRHRKPRHRRLALAVGGFALAAGALSLVRLAPESVTGGGGTAEAEPRIGAGQTAATAGDVPSKGAAGPSTTAFKGRASAVPAVSGDVSPSGRPGTPTPRVTDPATGIPEAPSTPTASRSRTPEPPVTTTAAPPSAPSPTATTRAPAPSAPATSDPPGLCVPLVGLCVHGL
ncbi:hypothetical protein SY2F82_24490 [Streptomyces sp. Y2F8-2]|uniref:hypothetical protein n=1 Tax=Streptomyces sp. Y2F8-2 TaxID=2759675 RepID=UPI00190771FB|nr:hypothetical protein [Streptomyces sp. Y2F8-2]GHK00652.1 hypothetical protein SY2F82_24490 [Streptomyces sp. Y2F8-2]